MHVWILGDGPERARLEALARERGVGSLVRFLGFQQNPWRFIARADVFVLTSTYEGFGNVLIEAMACGTPVVATRSPGTVEIIERRRATGCSSITTRDRSPARSRALLTIAALRDALVARGARERRRTMRCRRSPSATTGCSRSWRRERCRAWRRSRRGDRGRRVLGVLYTLSPLTVLSAIAAGAGDAVGRRGLDGRERRWFLYR